MGTVLIREVVPVAGSDTPAVHAAGLRLAYNGHVALAVDHLELARGTVTAVIGPNGSGKSTLLSAIAGLIAPVAGRLDVLGERTTRARHRVAYVLQATAANELIPLTVREVVSMGTYARRGYLSRASAADREAVELAMDRLGLLDLGRHQLHELSGGQRQRVYVAQGLAQRADILLLDEPTTGLDLPSQEAISQVLVEEERRGATIILTTHDVTEAASSDVVVLLAGRLIAAGRPDQVLRPDTLTAAYGTMVHVAPDGSVVIDDPHHHEARAERVP